MNDYEAITKACQVLHDRARSGWHDDIPGVSRDSEECSAAAKQLSDLQKRLSHAGHERDQEQVLDAEEENARREALEQLLQSVRVEHYPCLDHKQKMPCRICQSVDALTLPQKEVDAFIQAADAVAVLNLERPDSMRPRTVGAAEAFHRLEDAFLRRHGKTLADYPVPDEEQP